MRKKLQGAAKALEEVVDRAGQELERSCGAIRFQELPNLHFADVILGLLARQYQLWVVAILSPAVSTAPVAPLILRALADATITIAWLSANPESAQQYKRYSAGRLKLLMEHWKARETPEAREFVADYADQLTEIVDAEQWAGILPVELGSWNGKDIRSMAVETGLKDIYDLVYSPMSSEAHGEWIPLKQRFMRPCAEALHPTHWLPALERPYRITNFPPAATALFVKSLEIALGALDTSHRADFWDELQEKVCTIAGEIEESQAAGQP